MHCFNHGRCCVDYSHIIAAIGQHRRVNRAGSRFVTVAQGYYRVGGVGKRSGTAVSVAREPTPVFETSSTLVHGGRGAILMIPGATIKIICYNILTTVIHPHGLPPPQPPLQRHLHPRQRHHVHNHPGHRPISGRIPLFRRHLARHPLPFR